MIDSLKSAATKSWRTSLAGVLTFLGTLIQAGLVPLLDGVEATEPNWQAVMAAAVVCYGLLNTRDHSVSSKEAGVK